MTWRSEARWRIGTLVEAHQGEDAVALKVALMAAYPWGARRHYPYAVWREEAQRAVGDVRASRTELEKLRRWNHAVGGG